MTQEEIQGATGEPASEFDAPAEASGELQAGEVTAPAGEPGENDADPTEGAERDAENADARTCRGGCGFSGPVDGSVCPQCGEELA